MSVHGPRPQYDANLTLISSRRPLQYVEFPPSDPLAAFREHPVIELGDPEQPHRDLLWRVWDSLKTGAEMVCCGWIGGCIASYGEVDAGPAEQEPLLVAS